MAQSRLTPGSNIDGFLVGERIHLGGMASLWSVTRADIDFPILMKVPKLAEGEDPAAIVSFEMEQMILPRLSGPHVPRFVAAGDFAVQPYIVMERIEGTSLLPNLGKLPLPADDVATIGARVATALDALHRQHVVHLDVKPSNIMFRPNGEAVLIDFGLSRHDQLPDLMEEEFRLPYGTAPYMAPEQILGNRRDPRSDLFALGVLLYFFATGTRPFGDPQRLKGLKRRIWRDPLPPRKLRPDLPPWLQEVILRCLTVRPERRYASAAQLAEDLAHPDQVRVGERGRRMSGGGLWLVAQRWWAERGLDPTQPMRPQRQLARAPLVLVAIDTDAQDESLAETLRLALRRLIAADPHWRVTCIGVLEPSLITGQEEGAELSRSFHTAQLIALHHWARPLNLPQERIRFHVLTGNDAAAAILDHARRSHADHILMGARGSSALRRFIGSVSSRVVAEAPCSVTVVRAPQDKGD